MSQTFPLHPMTLAEGLGIRAIDTRAACLALAVRAVHAPHLPIVLASASSEDAS